MFELNRGKLANAIPIHSFFLFHPKQYYLFIMDQQIIGISVVQMKWSEISIQRGRHDNKLKARTQH